MNPFTVEKKQAFRIVGFKAALDADGGTSIHEPQFSSRKTTFFKSLIENGRLAGLRPYSDSPYGFAAVALENGGVYYYGGVLSARPLSEQVDELQFPEGDYLVLSGKGGLSRLAFDRLEDQAFGAVLTEAYEYEYTGGPIAEVLLNGNPTDAEAEVWVPVRRREHR